LTDLPYEYCLGFHRMHQTAGRRYRHLVRTLSGNPCPQSRSNHRSASRVKGRYMQEPQS
jgi:hypothetical protein